MSALRQSLGDYLAVRRSVGYKLDDAARILSSFVAFAERAGAGTITTELALSWAAQPREASPIWLAHRLSAVRGFAAYLHALDPATEIPPADLLRAPGYQPAPPYLYSDADVAALLAAARRLTPPLQAATFETLLGLLAAAGLRIGEAMRLDRDDIDWEDKALVVRSSKFGRSREVVCHDSTIEALRPVSTSRAPVVIHNRVDDLGVACSGVRAGQRPGRRAGSAGSGPFCWVRGLRGPCPGGWRAGDGVAGAGWCRGGGLNRREPAVPGWWPGPPPAGTGRGLAA